MMKRTIRSVLSAAVFLVMLILLIAGLSCVLEYKGSREKLTPFFERAEQIDVLFFGDSHAYSGIYPMELWENYGIASYNLANYDMTIPISYWVMRNALLSCSPELVVLDVNQIWEQEKLCASSGNVHTGLDGFPLSRVKLEAIFDLMDDPHLTDENGNLYRDLRPEFIFPFIKYHARWNSLTMQDLKPHYNQELGGERNVYVAVPEAYEITAAAADEQGYGFVYLRRFIEYCQDQGIRVLLTNLPYPCPNNNEEQLYTNAVLYTAEEYGVEYIDFVYLDQIVDYSTDCYDPASHLNPSGAWKVTDFIGQHLCESYGVPDRRGEAAYASWDSDYAAYRELKLKSLREASEPYSFLMLLADPSFSTILLLPESSAVYTDDLAMQLTQNIGRRHLMMSDTYDAVWADALMPLESLMQPVNHPYMAVIDRKSASVGECINSGSISTAFGSVTLDSSTGTVIVESARGSCQIPMQQDADVHAIVLDKLSGEIRYERAVKL
ncbi:MAG: hypothetical protein IJ337_04270 [Clostridia bacterium]|nr:hypothetical protein [Clostridia bacterium]